MTNQPAPAHGAFDHRMAVFGTDDAFVAAALPFLTEGLGAPGEPRPSPSPPPASWTSYGTPSAQTPKASA